MTDTIERFEIRVDASVLEDLRSRLARTRFPDQIEATGWEYGVPIDYLRKLVEYWRDEYDWRAQEARLNELAHYRTQIDGQAIHFVHARSPHAEAFPLLLIHGWPGSIVEFLDVIPALTDDFHVVAPSLPGYGFSEPTRTPGWDVPRVARAFVELMRRLGYTRYGAQGGDWGAQVVTRIGAMDASHCAAIHLNMPVASRPDDPVSLTDEEKADLAAMAYFQREEAGYAVEQGTKPQTLGVGLNDSPAGLLAWIVEKFRTWSDCDGDVETRFSKDELLTNVMIYWITGAIGSSFWPYYARLHNPWPIPTGARIEVPTAYAAFPREIVRPPRSIAETTYAIHRWTEMPAGGHFAALEEPEKLAEDIRAFFRPLR